MTPLRKEVEKVVGKSIYASLDFTGDFLGGTFDLLMELLVNFQLIALLFGVGEAIIFTRDLLGDMGVIAVALADIIVVCIAAIEEFLKIVFGIIKVLTFGFVSGPHIPVLNIHKVLSGDWGDTLKNIDQNCAGYTDWQEVIGFFFGQLTKNNVCVFLRYLEPVPWLYNAFHAVLGWLTIDPTPAPKGGNCEDTASEWLCACLGLGYVIVNLMIPLLLAFLVIKAYKPLVVKLVKWTWTLVHFVFHVVFLKLLRGHSLRDIKCFWEHFLCQRLLRNHVGGKKHNSE